VLAARRRGIWFDFGNGRNGHVRWDVAERAMAQGFAPDTFSTDWNTESPKTGVIDFPNVMSSSCCSACRSTSDRARHRQRGARLRRVQRSRHAQRRRAADVAILELRDGTFEFLDNYEGKRTGRQRLFRSRL